MQVHSGTGSLVRWGQPYVDAGMCTPISTAGESEISEIAPLYEQPPFAVLQVALLETREAEERSRADTLQTSFAAATQDCIAARKAMAEAQEGLSSIKATLERKEV